MGDILSTSVSGLLAFQNALSVTSNNISNASTTGYSVENVTFAEQPGQGTASGYIGNGVDVQGIARAYDEMLSQQVRSSNSSYASFNTVATQAAQVDNMLSDSSTGLTASLQSFVNALQSVASAPSSSAQRQVLLSQAQALSDQLQSYDSQISQYGSNLEGQIGNSVNQINTLASSIASLNAQIAAAQTGPGQTPNQLLDQRDTLVDQLSQYVSVNAVVQSDGQMNVYIGSGQALVVSNSAQQLTTVPNSNDASESDIGIKGASGGVTDITSEINGGSLGGLLTVRSQVLDPTQNALGLISVGLATVVNQQQASGMDLTGAQGTPMFAVGDVQTLPDTNNTGSASLAVTRTDLSALTTDNYKLLYSGGAWQLKDTTTGQPVTMTGTGTSADPFKAAGLSIVVSGAPANGDNYVIRPTATATAGLTVLLTDPSQIAAASLAQASPGATNTGTGTISSPTITAPSTWAAGTYTVAFTAANQYQVTNAGGTVVTSGTYTSGTPISFNGEQVTVSGAPAAGDTFTVGTASTANTGDNSNVLAMAAALSNSVLDGGTTSLSGSANNLISAVGVLTQQAQANASAQQSVNQSATDTRSNLTGVNLNEEAAKMLQYQQAYQACAQMIQSANTIFNSLITAIHG